MAGHAGVEYVVCAADVGYELVECRYDPVRGEHHLGTVVAAGTLQEIEETKELL